MAARNIKITGDRFTPRAPSWKAARESVRRAYWSKVGEFALAVKREEIVKGIGADGRKLKAVKPTSRPDGATGAPLDPHVKESRTYRLLAMVSSGDGATLFWRGHGRKSWATILGYHADGEVRGAPVRDTIGISPRGMDRIEQFGRNLWKEMGGDQGQASPPKPPRPPAPPPAKPVPPPKPPAPPPPPSKGPVKQPQPIKTELPKRIKGPTLIDTGALKGGKGKPKPKPVPVPPPPPPKPAEPPKPKPVPVPPSKPVKVTPPPPPPPAPPPKRPVPKREVKTPVPKRPAAPKPAPPPPPPPKPVPPPEPPKPVMATMADKVPIQGNVPDYLRSRSERTMGIIDKLHTVPAGMKPVPLISGEADKKYEGYFKSNSTTGAPIELFVRAEGAHPDFTLAHELGHFLDFAAIPGRVDGQRNWADAGELKPFLMAAAQSRRIQSILQSARSPRPGADVNYLRYLLHPDEMWARGYSQWVATRSGDPTLQAQLAMNRNIQWSDEDFEPIGKAIDELFAKLGWLKARGS